ncbi:MAG: transporter substrate-binding domain-containing protein [Balneolaceae bacterium]|nr:transporter substrate-binding domain-containing protein [Balneolaceae bacterium]
MRFKLIVSLFFAGLLLVSCGNPSELSHQMQFAEIRDQGSGTVTLAYVPSDGFSYENEEGKLTGVTIEIFRDFAAFVEEYYEVELVINYMPIDRFGNFYDTVRQAEGGIFGVANVTITEERKSELAFSPPYMRNVATLITHSDIEEISSFDDIPEIFNDLNALAFEGTLHEERLRDIVENRIPGALIYFAQSNNEIVERTAASNDYFAYVDIYNYWRASEEGMPLLRHEAGDEASEEFGIIMPLESDWHDVMAEFFEADGGYVHSDRYRQLMEAHLGAGLADLLISQMD